MEKHEIKTLKTALLAGLYVIYLMLSFFVSGELAYRFAEREMVGVTAYTLLAVHFVIGTAVFIYSFRKVSKE